MQLSPHFHLHEFTRSQRATREGWDNTPPLEVVDAIRAWCHAIGEPLRLAFARPITVSSGYRSPRLNRAEKGSKNSQHVLGEAADIEIAGVSNLALAQKIIDLALPFDQLILEFHTPKNPQSGWVHVSHRRAPVGLNRGQVLHAVHVFDAKTGKKKVKYLPGLQ